MKTALSRDAVRTTDWTRHLQGALRSFMSERTDGRMRRAAVETARGLSTFSERVKRLV